MPSLSSFAPIATPSHWVSTIRALMPLGPFSGWVRYYQMDAGGAPVGNPVLGAVEQIVVAHIHRRGALTGRIATGFRFRQAERADPFAGSQPRQVLPFLIFGPIGLQAPTHQGVVNRHDDRTTAVYFGNFLHRQHIGNGIHTAAAVFRRSHHPKKTQFGHTPNLIFRVDHFGVAFNDAGFEFFLGKFPSRFPNGQVFFG